MVDYRMVEIKGKHGKINLGIPNKQATEEEINELHRAIAEVIVNSSRKKEKATSK